MTNLKLPSKEILWVQGYSGNGKLYYLITSLPDRSTYYIYSVNNKGVIERVGKGKDPLKLEMKFLNAVK